MNISDHIIDDARYIASPNYDSRPEKTSISLIIIHAISMPVGEYVTENIVKLFTNELNPDDHPDFKAVSDLKVSSHLLITRSGDILQFVPFHKRAWHAGISVFEDQENLIYFETENKLRTIRLKSPNDTEEIFFKK